jgi:hypothetical protein
MDHVKRMTGDITNLLPSALFLSPCLEDTHLDASPCKESRGKASSPGKWSKSHDEGKRVYNKELEKVVGRNSPVHRLRKIGRTSIFFSRRLSKLSSHLSSGCVGVAKVTLIGDIAHCAFCMNVLK